MPDSKFKTRIKAEAGLNLPQQTAGRAAIVDGSGDLTSSTVTTAELQQLAGLDINAQLALKADKSVVDNIVTLTGVAQNSTNLGTFTGTVIPDNSTIKSALQSLETKVESIPNPIFYAGTYNASTNTPDLDLVGARVAGALYQVTVAGTHDFGAFGGSIAFEVGDKAVYNGTVWEKWDVNDAVLSVNGQTGVVVLDSDDVSEGSTNLYFTAARAKTAAVVNSTAGSETDQAPSVSATKSYVNTQIAAIDFTPYLRADGTVPLAADLDADGNKIVNLLDPTNAQDAATKAYVDAEIAVIQTPNDIGETGFAAANNQASPVNVTGLVFPAANVRSFKALVSVTLDATTDAYEVFELLGVQKNGTWDMGIQAVGDDSGVAFSITNAGQVQYVSANAAGFVSLQMQFRAITTSV